MSLGKKSGANFSKDRCGGFKNELGIDLLIMTFIPQPHLVGKSTGLASVLCVSQARLIAAAAAINEPSACHYVRTMPSVPPSRGLRLRALKSPHRRDATRRLAAVHSDSTNRRNFMGGIEDVPYSVLFDVPILRTSEPKSF